MNGVSVEERRLPTYLPERRNMLFPYTNANTPGQNARLEDCWLIFGRRIATIHLVIIM